MQEIIAKVQVELIEAELSKNCFLRHTNKGDNEIYVVDAFSAPNTMREVGRLREIAFRSAGGGTGLSCDVDEFDTMTPPCRQLIVWNPKDREIVGGYRYILGENIKFDACGLPNIATAHMFNFSKRFLEELLPVTIELGRSFVTLEYQSTKLGAKALYALDNLWDGLGALMVEHPQIKYLFGKVTMYPSYSIEGRNMLLYFLNLYFPDVDKLVTPIIPLETNADIKEMEKIFCGNDFKEDHKALNQHIRELGYNIPPLINAYMNLSPTMKMFGTAINYEFGNVEESGILVSIADIVEEKKSRHISSYEKNE
ncbi:MAG: GNAT family N-acetyltransferase [Muribaculaceae bacterium]